MSQHNIKVLIIITITALIGGLIHFISIQPSLSGNILNRLELISYDWRVRETRKFIPYTEQKLGFVFISDESINAVSAGSLGFRYGLYWPRFIYGAMLRELKAQQAKAVAFDVLFANLRPDHPPVEVPGEGKISSDEFFARQIRSHNGVILAASRGVLPEELFRTNAWATAHITGEKDPDGVLRKVAAFEDFRVYHPLLKLATKIETNRIIFTLQDDRQVSIPIDENNCFKLSDLGETPPPGVPDKQKVFQTYRLWHLGIALAALELGLDLDNAVIEPDRIILKGANGETRTIPTDNNHRFYIDWRVLPSDNTFTVEAIESLLEKDILRSQGKGDSIYPRWKDKLVVVGSTATGNDLTDLGATPIEKESFLVSTYWNVARSILDNTFITREKPINEVLIVVLMGFLSGWLIWRFGLYISLPLLGVFTIIYLAIAFFLFANNKQWLPVVSPILCGAVLCSSSVIIYRTLFEQREQKRIRSIFSRVVSPDVVNELLKTERLSLGGTRRKITIMFADIRGFTEFTDKSQSYAEEQAKLKGLSAEELDLFYDKQAQQTLETVNLYLSTVANIIKKYHGTLDKYIGDCVMAFWGAPANTDEHSVLCVKAAIEAQKAIDDLNKIRSQINKQRELELTKSGATEGYQPLPLLVLGTGINTGYAIVGLMGSEEHILNYTVFGREVNLASRLESISGYGRIIISESTYSELKQKAPELTKLCVKLEPVKVKGISEPVPLYEVNWRAYYSENKPEPEEKQS